MAQRAARMLGLPDGPGIDLYVYEGPDQRDAVLPSDLGWQHVAFDVDVDDIDLAVANVEATGGYRNADPSDLTGVEQGEGDEFVYLTTPWGSTVELITHRSQQPHLTSAAHSQWNV
jgi:hypothetical protein